MDFVRALSPADHERGIALLETASCPPEPFWDWDPATGAYKESKPGAGAARGPWGSYGFRKSPGDGRYYWHQAAPFAMTRWTNLYYPGDVIGEAVAPVFGPGVRDVRLEPEPGERDPRWLPRRLHWARRPGAHVRYWRSGGRAPLAEAATWLREIAFHRAGAEPPAVDERAVRSVNRTTARYAEVPEHLRAEPGKGRTGYSGQVAHERAPDTKRDRP
jgi:hypothetical protein